MFTTISRPTEVVLLSAGLATALLASALTAWAARGLMRRARKVSLDDSLTVLAAILGASFTAQGMWGFFRATLHLPISLTAIGFTWFEVLQLTCAVRARRNMLADGDAGGKAGAEGIVLWMSAAAAGFFSSTHATTWPEATFRLLVPTGVAWLWHRLMKLEHRARLTGKLQGVNWRLTPERILIRLGLADPTDRTAAQVSVERTLTTLAIAARRARRDRWWILGWRDQRRVDDALQRATEYARLATDPASQQLLISTLGVLNGGNDLVRLTPPAPWSNPTGTDLEGAFKELIAHDLLDVDDRTRAVLGMRSTVPTGPRLTWTPPPLRLVEPARPLRLDDALDNRDFNQLDDGDQAGQDADLDLTSTMRATILEADAQGVGERVIAKQLGITRYRVRKFLADQPTADQPALVEAVNGQAVGVDQ